MIAPLKLIINHTLEFLIPARCLLCYERINDPHGICIRCWQGLDFISEPFCTKCGSPFEFRVEGDMTCVPCLDHPPQYDHARASVIYNQTSRHLLLAYKHGDMMQASKILSRWMYNAGKELLASTDLMIPVPLHFLRLFARQYNQSAVLCNELHEITDIPTNHNVLLRSKYTVSQGKKDFKDRRKNVKSAFKVNPRYIGYIKDKNILLVDDVMTTGATIDECAMVLKKSGAKKVNVLIFARVTKPTGSF